MRLKEIHMVEMTMLEEHNYSAILGYLHAALATDADLAASVDVHKHVLSTHPDLVEDAIEGLLATMVSPDMLAITIYFWNRPQSIELARRTKQRWPACHIVFGGNDVTNQQKVLFAEAPFTQVLVHGEGELRFRDVCRVLLLDVGTLSDIDGISYWQDKTVVTTVDANRIVDLEELASPLLTDGVYSDYELGHTRLIIYETNRGCPYSCSFCFWGGATKSKVRQFSIERITAELERIVRVARDGSSLFVADANFGILGRDLEIAKLFVQLCLKYDKRVIFMTNWAKNSNSKVVEIASVLHEHDLAGAITLSAQSFDEHTLKLANRSNIKKDRYGTLQREFRERGIPTYTDLIWGLPGESLATHLSGVEQVLKSGGCPVVYPLLVLNNTEYANPSFAATHEMVTAHMPCDISDPSLKAQVVVGHARVTFQDWRRGMQHATATAVFAKSAMRCTLHYLSAISGVRIVDMVDAVMDEIDAGLQSCPDLTRVQRNHRDTLTHYEMLDMPFIDSILGSDKSVLEELHYQTMMYLVLNDAAVHRAFLVECAEKLIARFGLVGTPGLGDLLGVRSLDVVGGTIWRTGSSTQALTGMFAVSSKALAMLIESGAVPDWPYDPAASVVSGQATANVDRVGYWNTAYAMSLLRGARRLLFDAKTSLFIGARQEPERLAG